eukprot:489446-Lingulodinium_polyedra.AAC.1
MFKRVAELFESHAGQQRVCRSNMFGSAGGGRDEARHPDARGDCGQGALERCRAVLAHGQLA